MIPEELSRPVRRALDRRLGRTVRVYLDDLQGNILRAYGHPLTAYVFVRVGAAEAGRRWLEDVLPQVTTAAPWSGPKPPTTLNLAFTHAGLAALGVPDRVLATFEPAFGEGMARRALSLGDAGQSAPDNWEAPLGSGDAHVLAMIDAATGEDLDRALEELRAGLEAAGDGLAAVGEQRTKVLPFGREHFGFSDGFSQPAVEGSGVEPRPGQGTPEHGGWRPLRPGEFVLGYEDEDGVLPDAPAGVLGRDATYMIYRKLYQDVALFRRFVRERARLLGGDPDFVAAKIVGRWEDGTPLVLSPYARDKAIVEDRINEFRYESDPDGHRCPLGAHIRRTNPRDALGWGGRRTFRHRLIRRGMPYGPPLPPGSDEDDGEDRGLVFVCFNASIARQFETVQIQWANDGNLFGLGDDKDLLLGTGEGTGKMTVQGRPPAFLAPQEAFVVTRGGEYLFLPGMAGLRALAAGAAGDL